MPNHKPQKSDSPSSPDYEKELSLFKIQLKNAGLRLTSQRLDIFEEVFGHHGHLDAEEITRRLQKAGKKVGRATVYRTLFLLVETGLVRQTRLGTSQQYFEHIHPGEHHDHLVCNKCGKVIEFYSDEIENYQNMICDREDFKPERHTMVIFGTCSVCLGK